MAIKVFADTASNLFPSLLKEKGVDITVIKMPLQVGRETFMCYEEDADIEDLSKRFYEAIDKKEQVRTSLINPFTFTEAFKPEVDKGNEIICFVMAKGISGTYEKAVEAANQINEEVGKNVVRVIDTATAGLGEGLQALHAYELVKADKSLDEIEAEANEFRWKVRSEFTVDDIRFLSSTGRVKPVVARIANLMQIKVILRGSYESSIEMTGKAVGMMAAIKKLANQCKEHINKDIKQTVYITHCNSLKFASLLKRQLIEGGIKNIEIYPYDLITGSHVGPGCVALFYVGDNRDL